MAASSVPITTALAPATSRRRTLFLGCLRRRFWMMRCDRRSTQGAAWSYKKTGGQPWPVADREGLGRSRGGVTTKIHLVADSQCRPISWVASAGRRHDCLAFAAVMADIRIGRGHCRRPRTRPDRVMADKAYSTRKIRIALRSRGIKVTIPEPSNQIAGRVSRGSAGGRSPRFEKQIYKDRNTVERGISRLRGYRAVATRYDKREVVYKGTIDVASIVIWLRDPTEADPRDTP